MHLKGSSLTRAPCSGSKIELLDFFTAIIFKLLGSFPIQNESEFSNPTPYSSKTSMQSSSLAWVAKNNTDLVIDTILFFSYSSHRKTAGTSSIFVAESTKLDRVSLAYL